MPRKKRSTRKQRSKKTSPLNRNIPTWFLLWPILLPFWLLRKLFQAFSSGSKPAVNQTPQPTMSLEDAEKVITAFAKKLISETMRELKSKMTASNYATSKKKLQSIFDFCDKHHVGIADVSRSELFDELKVKYEEAVRKEYQKEEQRRIKERIREEQRFERDRQRELKRLEAEEKAIQEALAKALRDLKDEHSDEVERLRAQLREAEERSMRAKSQAQLTKAGYVYVISNIGSFGENVYKVGMTRRLEPLDRVRELGDASVPFSFDVHMMISCDDAPTLEHALHQELRSYQVNRINTRKEFFRVDLDTIREAVERNHGVVEYTADPEALEYYESLSLSDEDLTYLVAQQSAFEEVDEMEVYE